MLEAQVAREAGDVVIRLKGSLNEDCSAALEKALDGIRAAPAAATVLIDCAGIQAINSPGVALWLSFVEELGPERRTVFRHCSIYFVDYLNMVRSLAEGCEIASFYMPFHCSKCKKQATILLHSKAIETAESYGSHHCPSCSGELVPDVHPEDYLAFLFQ